MIAASGGGVRSTQGHPMMFSPFDAIEQPFTAM
jgi:hypothetical protein